MSYHSSLLCSTNNNSSPVNSITVRTILNGKPWVNIKCMSAYWHNNTSDQYNNYMYMFSSTLMDIMSVDLAFVVMCAYWHNEDKLSHYWIYIITRDDH